MENQINPEKRIKIDMSSYLNAVNQEYRESIPRPNPILFEEPSQYDKDISLNDIGDYDKVM